MKPLPAGIPGPQSRKWHSRRWWDSLGYLRVRTLSNPSWKRDMPWLRRYLRQETPEAGDPMRPLWDRALMAAVRYPMTRAGVSDEDRSWDELLDCVDRICEENQRRHLEGVRAAGVSGGQVLPAEDFRTDSSLPGGP